MAYVVARQAGRFEIRESSLTTGGPRARTLATFRELNDEVMAHAEERAGGPLDRAAVRVSARRVGAPVAPPPGDGPAGELLRLLARRVEPTPVRARLVAHALAPDAVAEPEDHLRAAGEWAGIEPAERGLTLIDLLGLVDAIPARTRNDPLRYPRLRSAA